MVLSQIDGLQWSRMVLSASITKPLKWNGIMHVVCTLTLTHEVKKVQIQPWQQPSAGVVDSCNWSDMEVLNKIGFWPRKVYMHNNSSWKEQRELAREVHAGQLRTPVQR